MSITPKRLFLIDGIGAVFSALSLGLILTELESFFGMPRQVLYPLSLIAVFFAFYSLTLFIRFPKNWPSFMKGIAIANLIYCCITLIAIIIHYSSLSHLGIGYFIAEILIIIGLVSIELKTASKINV